MSDAIVKEINSYTQEINSDATSALSEVISNLGSDALSEAQKYEALAQVYQQQLEHAANVAQEYAQNAAGSGDNARAQAHQSTADWLNNLAAQRSEQSSEAFVKQVANEYAAKVASIAEKAGTGIDVAQQISAAASGDLDRLGEKSAEILGGIAGAAMLYSMVMFVTPVGWAAGAAIIIGGFLGDKFGGWWWNNLVKPDVNADFQAALNWVQPRDPLALDLDGDGIETVGANGSVLFDHEGDGIREGTGWIKSDDGILALDRNGNGTIDTGAELFGDNYIKSNGERAANGYDALSDLDANGDGQFDANDAAFGDVRVWRDLNQDGASQAGELFTLADLGIASIATQGTAANTNLGNGNSTVATGTYTKTDGTQGGTGSLNLANNPFYREFIDEIEVPPELAGLPDMQGSGAVRDLREASVLNADLAAVLAQYSQATTREEQVALLDQLLDEWASSSTHQDFVERIDGMTHNGRDVEFRIHKEGAASSGAILSSDSASGGGSTDSGFVTEFYSGDELKVGRFADNATLETMAKIRVLEAFNNQEFFNLDFGQNSTGTQDTLSMRTGPTTTNYSFAAMLGPIIITDEAFAFSSQQQDLISQSYTQLQESVYQSLVFQTRLKPYMDGISLEINDAGALSLNFDGLNALIGTKLAADALTGLTDLSDLLIYKGSDLIGAGWVLNDQEIIDASVSLTPDQLDLLNSHGFNFIHNTLSSFTGENGLNIIVDSAGASVLSGGADKDIIVGGAGNDTIYGRHGADVLLGGSGNDLLYGNERNDILDGGAGNDRLDGGIGSDTYLFGRGDGQDTINSQDTSTDRTDVLRFKEGISAADVVVRRVSNDLVLSVSGTTDKVTVNQFFYADSPGNSAYAIQRVEFADGTAWETADLLQLALAGSGGNDTLMGTTNSDTISGGDGADILYGRHGHDTLLGGSGNDSLYGNERNDVLDGGAGNDYLNGGDGSDTYRLGHGDGKDTIYNYDKSGFDQLVFDEGVIKEDLWFSRNGSSLVVTLAGTNDQMQISNWYYGANYQLDALKTADYSLDRASVEALVSAMAAFAVPGAGQVITPEMREQIDPVIAANWQTS